MDGHSDDSVPEHQHLWAHGQHKRAEKQKDIWHAKVPCQWNMPSEPENSAEKATYRKYLVLAKITRRSWPSSALSR
ncbi:hypothetical protein ACJMK2_040748, partial [Sinanodonta woodiana]